MRYLILLLLFPSFSNSQSLTNTVEFEQNLYTHSVNILLDSLSRDSDGIFILEGNAAIKVHSKLLTQKVYNAEQKRIFNHKSKLLKEYKNLVGENLIRIVLKPIYIEQSRVKIPVFLIKTFYKTRKKKSSGMFGDGAWTFIYSFNPKTNFFELESIDKGLIL